MFNLFKSPIFTYIGVLAAVFAMLCGYFGWINPEIAWGIAGIFGFGSVASLRAFIESKGWKTYVATGVPIICGVLLLFGVIDMTTYQGLVALFATLTAGALQQAASKAANGVQPVKKKAA